MSKKQSIKLRKSAEDEEHGPMDLSELIELSRAAFVAPEDEVSIDGSEWSLAHKIPELEMEWIIKTGEGIEYGPTSAGTIKEFLMVGEISEETTVYNKESEDEKTVGDILGESALNEVKEEQKQASQIIESAEKEDEAMEASMDVAKDIRIHQLEVDYKEMESKYNSLMLKFRKLSEEMTTMKKG